MRGAGAVLAVLLLHAVPAVAEVDFRAEVSAAHVGLDDTFELTATVSGSSLELAGDIEPPSLVNLRIVAGPSVSTQLSFVNGAVSQSRSLTWVLQPTAVGTAEIGALRAPLKSGERTTEPIRVDVVEGSLLPARPQTPDPFGRLSPFGRGPFDDIDRRPRAAAKLFVEAAPSRTRLYVGEPLLVTYYLYTQAPVAGLDFDSAPSFPGFWAEELERDPRPAGEVISRDGERFERYPVLRRLLFPMKAGPATIPASTLRVMVPGIGFFERGGVVSRATRPVSVDVMALPAGEASGAVGRFSVRAVADRTSVAIGEAATLRFTVSGAGNLKWLEAPPALEVRGARVYPPQAHADVKVTPAGMSGSRTWEYVVVPETAGTVRIPAIAYPYFDPTAGRTVQAASQPLELEVTGGQAVAAASPQAAAGPRPTSGLRLRADRDRPAAALPAVPTRVLGLVILLALAGHGLLLAAPLLRRSWRAQGGSGASLRGAIADLRRVRRGGLSKESAAVLVEKAVRSVFGDLDERVVGEGEREREVRAILHDAQFIRYAPQLGDYAEKLEEVAARAEAAIRRWA